MTNGQSSVKTSISLFVSPPGLDPYHYTRGAVPVSLTQHELAWAITESCWSAAVYRNQHRLAANFLAADWAVLDFDDAEPTLAEITRAFCDTTHIIGTTQNHMRPKGDHPPCNRFRLLLRLNHSCDSAEDYKFTMRRLADKWGADIAATDAARYFKPCREIVSFGEGYTEVVAVRPMQSNIVRIHPPTNSSLESQAEYHLREWQRYAGRNVAAMYAATRLKEAGRDERWALDFIQHRTNLPTQELTDVVRKVFKRG